MSLSQIVTYYKKNQPLACTYTIINSEFMPCLPNLEIEMNGTTTIHYHIVLLYVLLPPHSSLYPQPSGLLNQKKIIGPCYDKVNVDAILSSVVLDKNAKQNKIIFPYLESE